MTNIVILCGRPTADLNCDFSKDGMAHLKFTLAVDRYTKDKKKAPDFIKCVAFGKTAENISRFVSKGDMFLVKGNLRVGEYENKEGKRMTSTEVIVEGFEFMNYMKNANKVNAISKEDFEKQREESKTAKGFDDVDFDIPF